MPKKIFSLVFVLSLAISPLASHAGFFDIFRVDRGYQNSAQVKTAITAEVGLKRGDRSDVVLQVQQALTAAKLYAGDLSGLIGIKTENAIKGWQGAHGLPVTGILDTATINSILARGGDNNNRGGNGGGAPCLMAAPYIKVLSPNGGETYQPGQTINVTWNSCNIPQGTPITISQYYQDPVTNGEHYTNITTVQAGGTTNNDGSETVSLREESIMNANDEEFGQNFKILIQAGTAMTVIASDYSDNKFTIGEELVCNPGSEPSVHVLSPNGGESYDPGQTINVTWDTCNIPATDEVVLVFHQWQPTNSGSSLMNTPNDGSQEITLPEASEFGTDQTDFSYGQNFKIAVVWDENSNIRDYSDSLFSIGEGDGVTGTHICNAYLLYPHVNQTYELQDVNAPVLNEVNIFLMVRTEPGNDCAWNTIGDLVQNSQMNGNGGIVGIYPAGTDIPDIISGSPMVILGNLNFNGPSVGDRIYHQNLAFVESSYPEGDYNIVVQDVGNQHQIIAPIHISY